MARWSAPTVSRPRGADWSARLGAPLSRVPFAFYGFWGAFFEEGADVLTRSRLLEVLFPFLDPANETPLDDARLVLCSVFGDPGTLRKLKREKGERVQIVEFTGEARRLDPGHEFVDFTLGSDREGPRDCRCPYGLVFLRLVRGFAPVAPRPARDREFAVVVARDAPHRREFFEQLGRYRPVDGYGAMFGRSAPGSYWSDEYRTFLSRYKFVLSFENDRRRGYTTEKIVNALLAGCVPVYWGCPEVSRLVRKSRFLALDPERGPELVERIRALDGDDAAFDAMVAGNPWTEATAERLDARHGCGHAVERLREWLGGG